MDSQDFYLGIKTLSEWFNKKLTDTQQDIIFKSVKFIPQKAWDDIIEIYTKRSKPLPSNFPTPEDIVSKWYIWRNENPELVRKSFDPAECDECHGRGLLWYRFKYEPLDGVYEESVRCADCGNWKRHFNNFTKIPIRSRRELEDDPLILEIWPYENFNRKECLGNETI